MMSEIYLFYSIPNNEMVNRDLPSLTKSINSANRLKEQTFSNKILLIKHDYIITQFIHTIVNILSSKLIK